MLNAPITSTSPTSTPAKRRAPIDSESPVRPGKKRKIMQSEGDKISNGVKPKNAWGNGVPAPSRGMTLQESRKLLPIWPGREAIVKAVQENDNIVIIGEPGSEVPQYILDASLLSPTGIIAVTQPRKVAATTIALRVAAERSTKLGQTVGYSVRFDECSSGQTKIKFYTDGMLLREMMNDKKLSRIEVVVVDEAHERTLRTDMLLANLKRLQQERKKHGVWAGGGSGKGKGLKIIVMSASLQAEKFSNYLGDAPVLYVKGRQHPVRVFYTKEQQEDYLDSALRTFFQIHSDQKQGDVLIFLPGQDDIESLASTITLYAHQMQSHSPPEGQSKPQNVLVRPLYAALPIQRQHEAFVRTPPNTRKVVLATNIAETSVTIPGIRFVIDTGVCNEKTFVVTRKGSGLERLEVSEISQSSAIQRAGRAGRDAPGKCFRLYTEAAYSKLQAQPLPEIKRVDITFATLQQKCLGVNLEEVEWLDKPDIAAVANSRTILIMLGALTSDGKLTQMGTRMARLPLEPRLARALIESSVQGCVKEVMDIVSVLSTQGRVFFDLSNVEERDKAVEMRSRFWHRAGDHLTLLQVFRAWDELSAKADTKAVGEGEGEVKTGISRNERQEWCRRHYINDRAMEEASRIRTQIQQACRSVGIDTEKSSMGTGTNADSGGDGSEQVLKALFKGLVHNMALRQGDGTYKSGQTVVKIHPSSVLCDKKPQAIMFEELMVTTAAYARTVSAFPPNWQMSFSEQLRKVVGEASRE